MPSPATTAISQPEALFQNSASIPSPSFQSLFMRAECMKGLKTGLRNVVFGR